MRSPRSGRPVTARRASASVVPALAAALCVWAAAPPPATAKDLYVDCQQTGPEKRRLECDVRFAARGDTGQVAAKVVETDRALPQPGFEKYPRGQDRSAVLFLFDVSDPARGATVGSNIEDARRILKKAGPYQRFGVAALPGDRPEYSFELVVPLTNERHLVERRLGELKAKGSSSPIFLAAIEGIRRLGDDGASRRALFLFSDGRHEDTGYTLENVLDEAAKHRVAIFAFGAAERAADRPFLQPLRRMAEETAGRYAEADLPNRRFAPAVLDTVLAQVESGGRVVVDLPDVLSDQTVELTFPAVGGSPALTHRVQVRDLPPPESAQSGRGWSGRVVDWVKAHQVESALGAAAVLLLLLALVVWAVRGSRRRRHARPVLPPSQERTFVASAAAPPRGGVASGGAAALATLQPVLNGGVPHVVTTSMATIGRAKDCDICLSDATVSAHHATLVKKRDGFFELTDMGSRNGVRVNGERIERRKLSPGDKISFGAAPELRFVPGEGAGRAA